MSNLSVMVSHGFKNDCAIFLWPLKCPFQVARYFFQFQCMQSIVPSIPGKPQFSLNSKSLAVSWALGALKYSSPKNRTIAVANHLTHFMAWPYSHPCAGGHQQDTRDTVCQHAQCSGDLLDGAMAKVSAGIPPLPKKCVYFMTHSQNGFEEFDSHSKMLLNIFFSWIMGSSTK
jgi:hypothetical protein